VLGEPKGYLVDVVLLAGFQEEIVKLLLFEFLLRLFLLVVVIVGRGLTQHFIFRFGFGHRTN
jgi:hypothetical protein